MSIEEEASSELLAVFGEGGNPLSPDAEVCVLSGVPQGLGPLIAAVRVDDQRSHSALGEVLAGRVDVAETPVFRLVSPDGVGMVPDVSVSRVIPVAAVPDVGSASLATALSGGDLPAVLEALAFDVVVVPVVAMDDGLATRVFSHAEDSGERDVYLFSSAETLERFIGSTSDRLFIVQHGAGVVEYVVNHVDALGDVVFDAAGPSRMTISARDLTSFLDEDVDAVQDDMDALPDVGNVGEEPTGQVTGFDLGLDSGWGRIDLRDSDRREHQIQRLVAEQTRRLGDKAGPLRRDMRTWLGKVSEQASQAGGSQLAFLLLHGRDVGAAVSVVTYCHALGPQTGDVSHLDRVVQHLETKVGPEDSLVRIETPDGDIVRFSRIRRGDPRVGGDKVPLVNIDYWMAAPDQEHVGHVSVSSPHVDARDAITSLADNIVLNGGWVVKESGDEPELAGQVV